MSPKWRDRLAWIAWVCVIIILYFVGNEPKIQFKYVNYFIIGFTALSSLLVAAFWFIYGRGDKQGNERNK